MYIQYRATDCVRLYHRARHPVSQARTMTEFSFAGILWRMAFAIGLVMVTVNPSGHSYLHWLAADLQANRPAKAIVGLALLCGWFFFVRSAYAALGRVGTVLVVALFAAIVWWMTSRGWFTIGSGATLAWIVLTILGLALGIGMCWSLIRQRVSGQASVDRIDT